MTTTGRYTVHAIEDSECTRMSEDVLGASDALEVAHAFAGNHLGVYGAAVRDRETGAIDWGFGFGKGTVSPG
jgi:hypothetical protein